MAQKQEHDMYVRRNRELTGVYSYKPVYENRLMPSKEKKLKLQVTLKLGRGGELREENHTDAHHVDKDASSQVLYLGSWLFRDAARECKKKGQIIKDAFLSCFNLQLKAFICRGCIQTIVFNKS